MSPVYKMRKNVYPAFLKHLWDTDPWYILIKGAYPSRRNVEINIRN